MKANAGAALGEDWGPLAAAAAERGGTATTTAATVTRLIRLVLANIFMVRPPPSKGRDQALTRILLIPTQKASTFTSHRFRTIAPVTGTMIEKGRGAEAPRPFFSNRPAREAYASSAASSEAGASSSEAGASSAEASAAGASSALAVVSLPSS